jgi:RNA polymerase sigma-70 factor (ECF subfamily)
MLLSDEETTLVNAAQRGDTRAFTLLTKPCLPALRSLTYRMAGHPDDAEDLQQESLLRAFTQLENFRGDSSFKTWLFAVATHVCLDYLRSKRRWRAHAQVYAQEACRHSLTLRSEMSDTVATPGFTFDVREHVAFCFTCVARSLPPEQEAAIILREVFEFSNRDAAAMVGVSESVLRHHLAASRKQMEASYEGLCALVNKNGACYQCKELRDLTPDAERGPAVPNLDADTEAPNDRFRHRLRIVREAPLVNGRSRALHDLISRRIDAAEQSRAR